MLSTPMSNPQEITPQEITPAEVQALVEHGDAVRLVDVRQPWEYDRAHIPGVLLIPLSELSRRFRAELDPASVVICICEHGVRSAHAASFLAASGFSQVATMTGGMAAYLGAVETLTSESFS